MDTVSRGEMVESELDGLIRRRHDQRVSEEQGRIEDGWAESVRAHHARRREELCWEWLRFHSRQLRNHETTSALITSHHRTEIARYERILGINYSEGETA